MVTLRTPQQQQQLVQRGRGADKIGTHVARIAIADLDRVGRVFLHQPADQRLRAA